jgi:hypothetical protein
MRDNFKNEMPHRELRARQSSHLSLPADVSYVTSKICPKHHHQGQQLSENDTFRRHLTMAVIDLAETSSVAKTSSVLGILHALFPFKPSGCCAKARRFAAFCFILAMSLVSHETFFKRPCDGHLAIIVVFTVVHLGSAVGAGLHQDCTWSNVVILVGV